MIKAVIFDKDGVLIDSEDTHAKSTVKAFGDFGIELTADELKSIVGASPVDYMPIFAEKYNISTARLSELKIFKKKIYYEILQSAPIFHKTIELLKKLHEKKLPIALCTQGSKQNTEITLDLIAVQDYFNCIVTREDCTRRKPDPEPYLTTAMKLGLEPEDCLVIEDSEVGLKSALSAGMKCIVIRNDYTRAQNFVGALQVVDSADEIQLEEIL